MNRKFVTLADKQLVTVNSEKNRLEKIEISLKPSGLRVENKVNKYGPNVTKLIIKFIAHHAVPINGGIADGIEFIRNAERRKAVLESAESDAIRSIQLIKNSPDNPFGNDDEKIAEELLKQIASRK